MKKLEVLMYVMGGRMASYELATDATANARQKAGSLLNGELE